VTIVVSVIAIMIVVPMMIVFAAPALAIPITSDELRPIVVGMRSFGLLRTAVVSHNLHASGSVARPGTNAHPPKYIRARVAPEAPE
jgi:hypothetical protein